MPLYPLRTAACRCHRHGGRRHVACGHAQRCVPPPAGPSQAKFTGRIMRARDARVSFVSEVLQGVKLLKLFAWEPPTLAEVRACAVVRTSGLHASSPRAYCSSLHLKSGQVRRKRNTELAALMRGALFGTISTFLWGAAPIFVTVATFSLYSAISSEPFTAQKAFTSLTLFTIMRFPLNSLPNQVRLARLHELPCGLTNLD